MQTRIDNLFLLKIQFYPKRSSRNFQIRMAHLSDRICRPIQTGSGDVHIYLHYVESSFLTFLQCTMHTKKCFSLYVGEMGVPPLVTRIEYTYICMMYHFVSHILIFFFSRVGDDIQMWLHNFNSLCLLILLRITHQWKESLGTKLLYKVLILV